ncbi:hypothetical protein [Spirosoma sp. KCTC 42546]|uniref:hypothetical protein n=1 Tax=Spirosoma sp. KCTC 42546 TaxID=2520506 RepID=UPI00143D7EDA|nr:hypothetical protein [Spirosoma sp. KCTC 42546]
MLSTDSVKVVPDRKFDKGLEVYGRPDEHRVAGELQKSEEMKKKRQKDDDLT